MQQYCMRAGVRAVEADVWGAAERAPRLAKRSRGWCRCRHAAPTFAYSPRYVPAGKKEAVATRIYGADGVDFSPWRRSFSLKISKAGLRLLPVCIAKTQYSLSDNPRLSARPPRL